MSYLNGRGGKWARVSVAALAGFCLGGGCSVRGLNALVVGLEAAADELRDDDDNFFDWLEDKFEDDIDDLEDIF